MLNLKDLGFQLITKDVSDKEGTAYVHLLVTPLSFFDGSIYKICVSEIMDKERECIFISDCGSVKELLKKFDADSEDPNNEINLLIGSFGAFFDENEDLECTELVMPAEKEHLIDSLAKYLHLLGSINALVLHAVGSELAEFMKHVASKGKKAKYGTRNFSGHTKH